jgi:hypothetical protein
MILATFINPYGWRSWWEVFMQVTDSHLRWRVAEWQPAFFSFQPAFICFAVLSATFVFKYRKKLLLEENIIFYFLLFQALISIRQAPLWVMVAIPLTLKTLNYFYREIVKDKMSLARFYTVLKYFLPITFVVLPVQIILSLQQTKFLNENSFYPSKTISSVKALSNEGEIFAEYAWGGYLIWNLPKKKVFIDGRMPSWRWEANKEGESNNTIEDYIGIISGEKDYKNYFQKYHISVVVWPTRKPKTYSDKLDEVLSNKLSGLYKLLGMSKTGYYLTDNLSEDGWIKVYQDQITEVYMKPK